MSRRRRSRPRRRLAWLRRVFWAAAIGFVVLTLVPVLALRWIDPPTSAVIGYERLKYWARKEPVPVLQGEWVPWDRIPAVMALAVIAAEDQRFPDHFGFDLIEMQHAWSDYQAGGRLRGASTISQQVAKNLFLWQDRSLLRKGLEAWLTLLIEGLWSKPRILEIYLNIAQFGPKTYGIGAASWRFFDRPAVALSTREAALLAAVLPNPIRYRAAAPSPRVQHRAARIRREMARLGGIGYLRRLGS